MSFSCLEPKWMYSSVLFFLLIYGMKMKDSVYTHKYVLNNDKINNIYVYKHKYMNK